MNKSARTLSLLVTLLFPAIGMAGEATSGNNGNSAWMLTATALVLFMTLPGLALFYGGLVRSKNVLSILMQCFTIACVMSVLWMVFGYSWAFGDGGDMNAWLGSGKAFLAGVGWGSVASGIPESIFIMFQMTFVIITPALIIGAFAERMRFAAVLWFSLLWTILVYLPVCHWVWGGGWLQSMGLRDFAGGTVVHINAGVAALIAALVLGRRKGFPATAMPPHNLTMTVAGASMLWVGWFGFNAGSAVAANSSAGMAMLATHLAAAAGALTWMSIEWLRFGKPSVLGIVTGMVAGLGTITPASGFVGPAGALAIGVIAGIVCFTCTQYMKRVLKIDDSLDVFPVHGIGGIIGTLMTGIFSAQALGGIGYDEGMGMLSQIKVQAIGVLAIALWSAVASFIILKLLDMVLGLRVSAEAETDGLDVAEHEERGYIL